MYLFLSLGSLATLQERIAEQTDILASKQHQQFRNTQLKEIISDMDTVMKIPHTSDEEPIMVMEKGEDINQVLENVPLNIRTYTFVLLTLQC